MATETRTAPIATGVGELGPALLAPHPTRAPVPTAIATRPMRRNLSIFLIYAPELPKVPSWVSGFRDGEAHPYSLMREKPSFYKGFMGGALTG